MLKLYAQISRGFRWIFLLNSNKFVLPYTPEIMQISHKTWNNANISLY